jgi:hypothetical protein
VKKSALYILIALSTFSCSLKNNVAYQTINISLPHAASHAEVEGPQAGAHSAAPTSLSAFNCYAVNIIGPGMPADSRLACGDPTQGLGAFAGFVSSTTPTLSIQVPNGAARQISLIGTVQSGACPDINTLLNSQNGGGSGSNVNPYLLATTTVDVFSDVSVNLTAAYDPNNPKPFLQGCGGSGPQYAPTAGYTGHVINSSSGIVGGETSGPSDPSSNANDIFGTSVSPSVLSSIFGASITSGSTAAITSSVMGYNAEAGSGYQSAVSRLIWNASNFNLSSFPYGRVQLSLSGGVDANCPAQTYGFGVTAYVFAPTNPYPAASDLSSGVWMPFTQTYPAVTPQWSSQSGNLPLPISDLLVTGSDNNPYLVVNVESNYGASSGYCKSAAYVGAAALQLQKSGTSSGGSSLYISSNALQAGVGGYLVAASSTATFYASGGTPPYQFSDTAGVINPSTGVASFGTGSSDQITVTDAKGLSAQTTVTISSVSSSTPIGLALVAPDGAYTAASGPSTGCDSFTITTLGINGGSSSAPSTSSTTTSVTVAALNGVNGGGFGPSCSSVSSSYVASMTSTSSTTANYRQQIAGNYFFTVSGTNGNYDGLLGGAISYFTVNPGTHTSQYAFNGPLSATIGECTPYILTTSDGYGNPQSNSGATVSVSFGSAPSSTFYQDSQCTTDLAGGSVSLVPASSSSPATATVYIKPPSSSAVSTSFNGNIIGNMNGACPAMSNISSGAASTPVQLAVSQVTSSISGGGQCVALTIKTVDGAGNAQNLPSSASLFAYVMGGNQGGSTSIYPSSNCTGSASNNLTMNSGTSSTPISFYAYGSSPQSVQVVVSDEDTNCSGGANLGRVTKTISW